MKSSLLVTTLAVATLLITGATVRAEAKPQAARETLNHVLETDDSFVPALQLSGALNLQMYNLTRAEVDFERAAELAKANSDNRNEIQALSGLADVIFLQERPDDVREVVERMLEIGSGRST